MKGNSVGHGLRWAVCSALLTASTFAAAAPRGTSAASLARLESFALPAAIETDAGLATRGVLHPSLEGATGRVDVLVRLVGESVAGSGEARSREQVLAAFEAAGLAAQPVGQAGVVLGSPKPVTQLPGFAEGWWSVQDAGAQLAAELLAPTDGMRVLDACAAPGGKTAHLLELADIDLVALDADGERLERVEQNLDRLGLASKRVHLEAADAADLDAWWDGKPFDAVLADVPCTASGIVRRHPDIRWLRRENDVRRTATLQARILDSLWKTVAPGGRLLYVTCSVFPIEGARQALEFLQRHPEAQRLEAPGQLLPVALNATPVEQHDGFFYALFAKQS